MTDSDKTKTIDGFAYWIENEENGVCYIPLNLCEKIMKLLTEQEEVVHPEPSCEMEYITDCCCDLCGEQLIREDNFCRCCGKRIEWKGR